MHFAPAPLFRRTSTFASSGCAKRAVLGPFFQRATHFHYSCSNLTKPPTIHRQNVSSNVIAERGGCRTFSTDQKEAKLEEKEEKKEDWLAQYLTKIGIKAGPPRPPLPKIAVAGALAFTGMGALSFLHYYALSNLLGLQDSVMIIGSFGASCALLFGAPDAPLSQPRNVVGGHTLSALIGVACYTLVPLPWLAAPLSVSLSIMGMMATRTFHPPAAGNGLIFIMGTPLIQSLGWSFVLVPCLAGSSLLVVISLVAKMLTAAVKGRP